MLSKAEPRLQRARATVLVVEDEVAVRTILAEQLQDVGLCVVEARNADDAWRYIQAGNRPDLVFSDVEMPGSMNGMELARRSKARHPHIKFIVMSARPKPAGCESVGLFIVKPFSLIDAAQTTLESLKGIDPEVA